MTGSTHTAADQTSRVRKRSRVWQQPRRTRTTRMQSVYCAECCHDMNPNVIICAIAIVSYALPSSHHSEQAIRLSLTDSSITTAPTNSTSSLCHPSFITQCPAACFVVLISLSPSLRTASGSPGFGLQPPFTSSQLCRSSCPPVNTFYLSSGQLVCSIVCIFIQLPVARCRRCVLRCSYRLRSLRPRHESQRRTGGSQERPPTLSGQHNQQPAASNIPAAAAASSSTQPP